MMKYLSPFTTNTLSLGFCLLFLLSSACNRMPEMPVKSPSFIKIDKLRVTEIKTNNIVLKGQAVFNNPNGFSCKVIATDLDLIVDGIRLGKVDQMGETLVPANSEFQLPLQATFPPKKLFQDNKDFLSNVLSALVSKKVHAQFKGTVTIKAMKIPITIPVDYSQEVPLKRKK